MTTEYIIGNLTHYITIEKRFEKSLYNSMENGENANEYKKIYSAMCKWQVMKPVEIFDNSGNTNEPIKYTTTDKIILPYNPKLNNTDTFVVDEFKIRYKVSLIENYNNQKNWLILTLIKWGNKND